MADNMSASGGKNFFNLFLHELFYALSGALALFAGLEFLAPGMILAYFNLNYLLLAWLLNGIMILW